MGAILLISLNKYYFERALNKTFRTMLVEGDVLDLFQNEAEIQQYVKEHVSFEGIMEFQVEQIKKQKKKRKTEDEVVVQHNIQSESEDIEEEDKSRE